MNRVNTKLKTFFMNAMAAALALVLAVAIVSAIKYIGALYFVNITLLGIIIFSIFLFLMSGEDS